MDTRKAFGRDGENQARQFLEAKGLTFVRANVRFALGEIDLVFQDGPTWVFVEVKNRTKAGAFTALDSISKTKIHHIIRSVITYASFQCILNEPMRIDILTIEAGHITWYPNAIEVPSRYLV